MKHFMKYFGINDLIFPVRFKNYFLIFQETFLKYSQNIPGNDKEIYTWNVTDKHFMKYFCNNDLIFPVILKNYFSIFQEKFLRYFCDISGKYKAIYRRNVTEKHFMKYYHNIFAMLLASLNISFS